MKKIGSTSGTESLMLGLINHFRRIYPSVGFFKPVGTQLDAEGAPQNITLMRSVFDLPDMADSMFATDAAAAMQVLRPSVYAPPPLASPPQVEQTCRSDCVIILPDGELCCSLDMRACRWRGCFPKLPRVQMVAADKQNELVERCYEKLNSYEVGKDMVIINGWREGGISFNAALAAYADAPVLLSMDLEEGEAPKNVFERAVCFQSCASHLPRPEVPAPMMPSMLSCRCTHLSEVCVAVQMATVQRYRAANCPILGLALSSVPPSALDELRAFMNTELPAVGVPFVGMPLAPFSLSQANRLDTHCRCTHRVCCGVRQMETRAGAFPALPELAAVSLDQVYNGLKGNLLFCELDLSLIHI